MAGGCGFLKVDLVCVVFSDRADSERTHGVSGLDRQGDGTAQTQSRGCEEDCRQQEEREGIYLQICESTTPSPPLSLPWQPVPCTFKSVSQPVYLTFRPVPIPPPPSPFSSFLLLILVWNNLSDSVVSRCL